MRLIDVDKLVNDIAEHITVKAVSRVLAIIQGQPTVDAEPVRHGHWIDEGYYADYTNVQAWHCSECNCHVVGYSNDLFDYCPGCGAKMDEGEENAKKY